MAAKHKERKHAILSASGASRWMRCTPSARLELQFEEDSSEEADEGTLAHELAELILKLKLGLIARKLYARDLAAIQSNPLYAKDMFDYCTDYVIYVLERFSEAQAVTHDAVLLIEHRYDLSNWIPEGFGTGDIVIICDLWILVIDFKYGKGVHVDATENSQLKIYGLGAVDDFEVIYDFVDIEMVIFQPRLDNISVFKMPVKKLKRWGKDQVIPIAEIAFAGEGEFVAGDHCKFCKAKVKCKALAKYNNKLARYAFMDPVLMSDEEIADVLGRIDLYKNWMNAVANFALKEAVTHGTKWPGFKLVSGRSNRAYTKVNKIIKKLLDIGFTEDEIFKPEEILGITEMTKLIGVKDFNTHLTPYVMKNEGKPALVPLTDKRPVLNSNEAAKRAFNVKDFDEVEYED